MTPLSAPVDLEDGRAAPRLVRRLRPARLHIGIISAIAAYLAIAVLANWPAWSHGVSHAIQTSGGNDVQEEAWFLSQTPWAVIHGINPFGNGLLNAPVGINLMDNTSMLLLGLLGAPITLLFGPLATFNILLDLGFATSAAAAYLVGRRFVRWDLAAFLGGLLYGFSPYAVATGTAHLFLVFNFVPPLVVLVVDRTLRTRESSPLQGGILLGLALTAQFFISTEMFASLVVMIAVAGGMFVLYWFWRRPAFDMARLARFGASAVVVCALGTGYGAWMAVAGPNHISGPAQTKEALAGLSNDPLGLVVPTVEQRFTAGLAAVGDRLVATRDGAWRVIVDAPSENGSYIGIPLLCLLALGALALRRQRFVQVCVVMATAAMLLSFGARLHVDGKLTPVRLPFDVVAHLPLLDSSVAARYALFFWLFAALLFAVVVDSVRAALANRIGQRSPVMPRIGALLLALLALVPLAPAWPYTATRWTSPVWFTHTGRSVAIGSTVVVYPMASSVNSSAMVWQAQADMRFRMPGGYAVFRSPSGPGTFAPLVTPLQTALALCTQGTQMPLSSSVVRGLLRSWRTSYVVVPVSAPHSACAVALFRRALGDASSAEGVFYWQLGA